MLTDSFPQQYLSPPDFSLDAAHGQIGCHWRTSYLETGEVARLIGLDTRHTRYSLAHLIGRSSDETQVTSEHEYRIPVALDPPFEVVQV